MGREIANWAIDRIKNFSGWMIAGYLDDKPNALYGNQTLIPLISSAAGYMPSSGVYVVIAMGNPLVCIKLHEDLRAKGAQFANVIYPTAIVAESVRLSVGVVSAPFLVLSANNCVDDGGVINYYAVVQHDAQVGSWFYISSLGNVGGASVLGQ